DGGDASLVAAVQHFLRILGIDGAFDLDVAPVTRQVQALHIAGAVDEAQRLGSGSLRAQLRGGTFGRTDLRVGLRVARHAGTRSRAGRVRHAFHRTGARIGHVLEGVADAGVQFADRRGTEAFRPVAADHQVVDRLPAETELAVERVAEVAVVGDAGSHTEVQ